MQVFYRNNVDPSRLHGRRLAILGYGSQGRAHARNLADGGLDVIVGLREGSVSFARAAADGVPAAPMREAVREASIIMMLVPDQVQADVYAELVAPVLGPGRTLFFAHGFNVHFGEIRPPAGVDVGLVAPKAPGPTVRSEFEAGRGVPGLVAVHQDASGTALADALAWAGAIGCAHAGVLATTFREETETDLFGEQAVLCGGMTALVRAGFDTLVEAGYAPEMAYFECLHELKLIVDLMYHGGPGAMRRAVSDTAEFGDRSRGGRVVGESARAAMRELLAEIQDGRFAREWLAEHRGGAPRLSAWRAEDAAAPIETVGARLRGMMPWTVDATARVAP